MPPIHIERRHSSPSAEEFSKLREIAAECQVVILVVIGIDKILNDSKVFEYKKLNPGVYIYH